MRLIDADALDREMYRKSFEVDDGRNVWNSGLWIRYKIYEEAIRDAPTVDAVPVRHGKWLLEQEITDGLVKWNRWSCSCCGYVRTKGWATTSEGHKPTAIICENCGARMVEDE